MACWGPVRRTSPSTCKKECWLGKQEDSSSSAAHPKRKKAEEGTTTRKKSFHLPHTFETPGEGQVKRTSPRFPPKRPWTHKCSTKVHREEERARRDATTTTVFGVSEHACEFDFLEFDTAGVHASADQRLSRSRLRLQI